MGISIITYMCVHQHSTHSRSLFWLRVVENVFVYSIYLVYIFPISSDSYGELHDPVPALDQGPGRNNQIVKPSKTHLPLHFLLPDPPCGTASTQSLWGQAPIRAATCQFPASKSISEMKFPRLLIYSKKAGGKVWLFSQNHIRLTTLNFKISFSEFVEEKKGHRIEMFEITIAVVLRVVIKTERGISFSSESLISTG